MEPCVVSLVFRELLPDAGDGTRWDDNPDMPAQVPPAPPHKVPVSQVSVATVKNEYVMRQPFCFYLVFCETCAYTKC